MIGTIDSAASVASTQWIQYVVVPMVVALLTSGVVVYLFQRRDAARARRREGYAEAVAAVVAWVEYPFSIRRRSTDDPDTLSRLASEGHVLQERLARALTWVASDNAKNYDAYEKLVDQVRSTIGPLIRKAWDLPPIRRAGDMNLNGWGTEEQSAAGKQVRRFIDTVKKHFRGP